MKNEEFRYHKDPVVRESYNAGLSEDQSSFLKDRHGNPSEFSWLCVIVPFIVLVAGIIFGSVMGAREVTSWQNRTLRHKDAIVISDARVMEGQASADVETQKLAYLTPAYLQYLSIQAQIALAGSKNKEVIYLPNDFAPIGILNITAGTQPTK